MRKSILSIAAIASATIFLSGCFPKHCPKMSAIQTQVLNGHAISPYNPTFAKTAYHNGVMCLEDTKDPSNINQGVEWVRLSAISGNTFAMYKLANMYLKGLGVRQDQVKAFEWMHKAAASGYPYAIYSLGYFYQKGIGVEANAKKAEHWFNQLTPKQRQKIHQP